MADETPHELITGLPSRHPHTFKCLLYLVIFKCPAVSWEAVDTLMRRMGYEKMDIRIGPRDGSYIIGAPTYALVPGDESLNSTESI